MRFETPPGRQLQIDFGERLVVIGDVKIKAFVFVATLGTRDGCMSGRSGPRSGRHWFSGLESAFTTFGGVPEEVLMDNPRALVVAHEATSRSVQFQRQAYGFCETLGFSSSRLCALSGAHEGQDGERCRLREEERDRGTFVRELGGVRGASRAGSGR